MIKSSKLKILTFIYIVPVFVLFDQLTKKMISRTMSIHESISVLGNIVRITLVNNEGMITGFRPQDIMPNMPVSGFLTIFMGLATVVLVSYYIFNSDERIMTFVGLSLIISGAAGNLIDRISMGKVIDFVDIGINNRLRWPVFNVADSCITVGIIILLIMSLKKPESSS